MVPSLPSVTKTPGRIRLIEGRVYSGSQLNPVMVREAQRQRCVNYIYLSQEVRATRGRALYTPQGPRAVTHSTSQGPTSYSFHEFPKRLHHLGPTYSNTQACGGSCKTQTAVVTPQGDIPVDIRQSRYGGAGLHPSSTEEDAGGYRVGGRPGHVSRRHVKT